MAKENKKCAYITDDNLDLLSKFVNQGKKKSMSYWLNRILDEYRAVKRFVIKGKEGYITIKISCKSELVEVLKRLEKNFDTEAVVQLVNTRLLEEFVNQDRQVRRKYPDRLYSGDNLINRLAEKCKKILILKR